MNQLVKEITKGLLEQEKKTIAVYGGGFKPPTKGHFEVVKQALDENPEIDEFIIYVGKKDREGVTQEDSMKIWGIYKNYLPNKVKIKFISGPPSFPVKFFLKGKYNFFYVKFFRKRKTSLCRKKPSDMMGI